MLERLCLLIACCSFPVAADIIRISGYGYSAPPNPPYRWVDWCSGQPKGSSIRLIEKALEDIGHTVEWIPPTPDLSINYKKRSEVFYQWISEGRIDFTFIPRNAQYPAGFMMSTYPAFELLATIVYRKSMPVPKPERVIRSDRTGFSSVIAGPLRRTGNASKTYKNSKDGLQALLDKEIDYYISDYYLMRMEAENLGFEGLVSFQPFDQLKKFDFFMVGLQSNVVLMEAIGNQLQKYRQQGLPALLARQYLQTWVTEKKCDRP